MKPIYKYLSTKITNSRIKATNETIKQIVKDEVDRLGPDADLNYIDVSEVSNMRDLFSQLLDPYAISKINPKYIGLNPDISEWDVSNVKNMDSMFRFCSKFNCDISKWNVSQVKNMYQMFYECESFNQDISNWDVRNVESVRDMFYSCKSFDQDLSKWNMPKAGPIYDFDMFYNCPIKDKKELLPNIRFRK